MNEVYEQFNIQHDNLIQALAVQENVDMETENFCCKRLMKKYVQIRTIYYDTFEALAPPTNTSSASVTTENVKLSVINVPTFSGDLEYWHSFISLYDSLIHKRTNLTDIQKLQYLLSSLTGDASSHIKHQI
ncbi:hypothetical protein JTB14_008831 [Gonioctena quinquepunctata]|nr:hypothetical protein JTB14_008831 [Gonioctena quinquepunctata]